MTRCEAWIRPLWGGRDPCWHYGQFRLRAPDGRDYRLCGTHRNTARGRGVLVKDALGKWRRYRMDQTGQIWGAA